MRIPVQLRLLVLCIGLSATLLGTDVATLRNGFEVRHERSERMGDIIRLYVSADEDSSYIDVPAGQVLTIQHLEQVALPEKTSRASTSRPGSAPAKIIDELVNTASRHHLVDADLIRSVIHAESNFNPAARSAKGAQGLMQLMPATAARFNVKNALEPEANVNAGTSYLHDLLVHYEGDIVKTLAAYNAGPERVSKYHGVPPFPETRSYVARVVRDFNRKKSLGARRVKQ